MAVDYYKVLGIDRNTPQKDIKSAYRKRSKQFHPDLHPDDPKAEAKFKKLQEAYNVLGDENKRKLYDQYGENWENMSKISSAAQGLIYKKITCSSESYSATQQRMYRQVVDATWGKSAAFQKLNREEQKPDFRRKPYIRFPGMELNIILTIVSAEVLWSFNTHSRVVPTEPIQ